MMECELLAEVGDSARFADLARGWFTGVLADVFPGIEAGLAAEPVLYKRQFQQDVPWGEPGAVWAHFYLGKKPDWVSGRWTRYTAKGWRRFLDGLGDHPFTATIEILPLDEQGLPARQEGSVTVKAYRLEQAPGWVVFRFSAGARLMDMADAVGSWTVFARKQAEDMRAVYGHIRSGSSEGTTLEYATAAWPEKTIPRARAELRGYEWATLVAPELIGRLGGIDALEASGAFHEVAELCYGGAWLQATAGPEGYGDEQARRVFGVLAPVLIGGVARRPPGGQKPLAYDVDAADYRHAEP